MFLRKLALFPPLLLLCALAVQCTQRNYRSSSAPIGNSFRTPLPEDFESRIARYGLVDLRKFAPSLVFDLRYAAADNVTGAPIYPRNMPCLLRRQTAKKLVRAQRELQAQGYGLKIWDAWRPARSHLALWDAAPNGGYVVPPSAGFSRHCLGTAVDVTLVDARGRELRLPTGFDNFTPAASSTYIGSSFAIRENLAALQTAMRNAGFSRIGSEWWHFSDPSGGNVVFSYQLGIQLPDNVRKVKFNVPSATEPEAKKSASSSGQTHRKKVGG
ncbi:MAG: D-alanyl-D-alanine dipeptidase [Verrucomicrobiales bacterium]|jgi:D-alanyl-D-alanine dipeptidase